MMNHHFLSLYSTPTKTIGIPFETEDQLRERGTSKTPDILLSTPVAVQIHRTNEENEKSKSSRIDENKEKVEEEETWRIVCWIDSKVGILRFIKIILFTKLILIFFSLWIFSIRSCLYHNFGMISCILRFQFWFPL
jgi:Protein of unknown function TPD sequence-motif